MDFQCSIMLKLVPTSSPTSARAIQPSDRQRLHLNLGCPISALASRPSALLHSPTRAAVSGEKIRRFQPSAAASDYSTSRLSARCGGDERAGQWLHENGSVTRRKLVGVGAMDGAAAGLLRKCSICNEYGHRAAVMSHDSDAECGRC